MSKLTKEDREEAMRFYFKNLTLEQLDWVESESHEASIDKDVIALANLLSEVRNSAETRGFLSGLAAVTSGLK